MKCIVLSIITIVCICLAVPQLSIAQESDLSKQIDHTQVVTELSSLLRGHYVFEETGNMLADLLLEKLGAGLYMNFNDPEEFAQALTDDIQATNDKHLVVIYDPETANALLNPVETAQDEVEYAQYLAERAERSRRQNYGFHKLEILEGNIGYLDLRSFDNSEHASDIADAAMSFLSNSDAIILDLRRNTGGGASMFQQISSYFFDENTVDLGGVYFREGDQLITLYSLEEIVGVRMPDIDLYILTGEDTYSAAEAFAYAFKHLGRATIIGIVTQGGAHMTDRMPISSEFYAMISIAAGVNSITHTNWEGVGVIPHILTSDEDVLKVAHIQALNDLIKNAISESNKQRLEEIIDELNTQ